MEMDKGGTGLGQWTWTKFDTRTTRRQFVLVYCPSVPIFLKKQGIDFEVGTKVYEQQYRYNWKKGYHNCDPIYHLDTNLLAHLNLRRMQDNEVLLMIDLNKRIYTGNFAKALAEQDILMDEIFYQVNSMEFMHH